MAISPERQDKYELIIELTPGWQEARDKAQRAAGRNSLLNRDRHDAFAPINRLLDEIIELNLSEAGGEQYGNVKTSGTY